MKTLILSTLLAASICSGQASTVHAGDLTINQETRDKAIGELEDKLNFQKKTLEVLWQQYDLALAHIKNSRGNHTELDTDYTFFSNVYKKDIREGRNVKEAEKTLEELKNIYEKKHALRNEQEQAKISELNNQMEKKIKKEIAALKKVKGKNNTLLTKDVLPLLLDVEKDMAQSFAKVEALKETSVKQSRYYAKFQ